MPKQSRLMRGKRHLCKMLSYFPGNALLIVKTYICSHKFVEIFKIHKLLIK